MYGYGIGYYESMIVLIPAMIFTMIVQMRIKQAYSTYSQIENSMRMTGAQAARAVLDANGLSHVPVKLLQTGQSLTNYFDPRTNTVNLSRDVYGSDSIASMCIACHEVGHAIQYATGYGPIKFRNSMVPLLNLTSGLAWPLILIGLMASRTGYGSLFFSLGVLFFALVILFHAVTLPVELNASNRALGQMRASGIVSEEDLAGSRRVLRAAAMTYVAALASAVSSLLQILIMSRGRR